MISAISGIHVAALLTKMPFRHALGLLSIDAPMISVTVRAQMQRAAEVAPAVITITASPTVI